MHSDLLKELEGLKVDEVKYIESYKLHFKKVSINKTEIFAYSGSGKSFTIDLKTAKELAFAQNISVVDVKDCSHPEYRGAGNLTKWAFLVTVKKGDDIAINIGSASTGNIGRSFEDKGPEMAYKRAYIRAVLDVLKVTELAADKFEYAFEEDPNDKAAVSVPDPDDFTAAPNNGGFKPKKKTDKLITNNQKNMIESLWKSKKVPKADQKMPRMASEAEEEITRLSTQAKF